MALNPRITDWPGRVVWIVGASTGIGQAVAQALAQAGATVVVSARQAQRLHDFVAQHPGAMALPLDVADAAALREATQTVLAAHRRIDLALFAVGTYQPLRATAFSLPVASQHLQVNVQGALNWLDAVLPPLLTQAQAGQGGHLSLISSIVASRGLPQALAYGPTKAYLSYLADVLYLDLHPCGLGVSVVQPGFVATPLTAQNEFAMPALIQPEQAAQAMLRGWARGDFDIHFPKRFTRFLKALRCLPDRAYFAVVRRFTGL